MKCAEQEMADPSTTLIVTSDVKLTTNLADKGIPMIMKSGDFFKEFERVVDAQAKANIISSIAGKEEVIAK